VTATFRSNSTNSPVRAGMVFIGAGVSRSKSATGTPASAG